MTTAVAILNWNGSALLRQYLPSVVEHSGPHQVVVIDNGSTDDSLQVLRDEFPSVTVVDNGANLGFSEGYNVGLQSIEADIVILLNSDVAVTAGWIDKALPHFSDESVWALQPKMLDDRDRERFEYAGAAGGYLDRYGFPYCRGRIFQSLEVDRGQYDTAVDLHWGCGAALFIRKERYYQAGGLDADFFAHMEEIDLCWRIRNLGGRIVFSPESTVYHLGGGTLQQGSAQKAYLNFRNNLYILLKNHRGSSVILLLFIRMAFDGVAAYKFLFSGQVSAFFAVAKAHVHFYRDFLPMWRKRKSLMSHEPVSSTNDDRSIVWAHFVKGKDRYSDL